MDAPKQACEHCRQPIELGPGGDLYALITGSFCPENHRGVGHRAKGDGLGKS
jgi:hypothetical protein